MWGWSQSSWKEKLHQHEECIHSPLCSLQQTGPLNSSVAGRKSKISKKVFLLLFCLSLGCVATLQQGWKKTLWWQVRIIITNLHCMFPSLFSFRLLLLFLSVFSSFSTKCHFKCAHHFQVQLFRFNQSASVSAIKDNYSTVQETGQKL